MKEKSIEKKGSNKIDSIKQIAEYFDHTDTEELEWEDADLQFERPEMAHISVRIPKQDLIALKKAARELGLGYTAYVRMLLHKSAASSKTDR